MKTDIALPDFRPRDRHRLFVLWMHTAFEAESSRAILAHLQLASVPLENRPKCSKDFFERNSCRLLHFLPNVKDEPRPQRAWLVPGSESRSGASNRKQVR